MALKSVPLPPSGRILVELPSEQARALVTYRDGMLTVVDDRCRHRAGPIHLCYEGADGVPRCPWHDRLIGKLRTSKEVSAVVDVGKGRVTLVTSHGDDSPWPVRLLAD